MGMVATARVFSDQVKDSGWEINALTRRITRTFHATVPSTTKIDDTTIWYTEKLMGVIQVPSIGDAYPSRSNDTYCRGLSSTGLSNNDLFISAYYEGIGQPGYVCNRDSYQTQVIRNYDVFGNPTIIPYLPTPFDSTRNQLVKPRHLAGVPMVVSLPCIRFTIMCLGADRDYFHRVERMTNKAEFNKQPPRTWLVMSIKSQTENNKLHRVDGVLCYRKESWDGWGIYLDVTGNKADSFTAFPPLDNIAEDTAGLVPGPFPDPDHKGYQPLADPIGWRRFIMYEQTNFKSFEKFLIS